MKPADAVVPGGASMSCSSRTTNFHHELEFVTAIGKGGSKIPVDKALEHVHGCAAGNDFTRRDLQTALRNLERPWDVSQMIWNVPEIKSLDPLVTLIA